MPIYVYRCSKCNKEFEKIQPMGEYKPEPCPVCEHKSPKVDAVPGDFQWGPGPHWSS